eukprot:753267-Rhodomonas_salina.5
MHRTIALLVGQICTSPRTPAVEDSASVVLGLEHGCHARAKRCASPRFPDHVTARSHVTASIVTSERE